MEQKLNMIRVKWQRWSDDVSQRIAEWWHTVTHSWHSELQRQFDAAKMTLMGMYNKYAERKYRTLHDGINDRRGKYGAEKWATYLSVKSH